MIDRTLYYKKWKKKVCSFLGEKCAICGSTEELQVDHINHEDKATDISKNWALKWESQLPELKKCQLLCKEHHTIKTKKEGSLTKGWNKKPRLVHGSYWTYYKHKCRCDLCIKGKEKRNRKEVQRRRNKRAV